MNTSELHCIILVDPYHSHIEAFYLMNRCLSRGELMRCELSVFFTLDIYLEWIVCILVQDILTVMRIFVDTFHKTKALRKDNE